MREIVLTGMLCAVATYLVVFSSKYIVWEIALAIILAYAIARVSISYPEKRYTVLLHVIPASLLFFAVQKYGRILTYMTVATSITAYALLGIAGVFVAYVLVDVMSLHKKLLSMTTKRRASAVS